MARIQSHRRIGYSSSKELGDGSDRHPANRVADQHHRPHLGEVNVTHDGTRKVRDTQQAARLLGP
jgi:hypothetical protein